MNDTPILVCGAGGFIGGHLVASLMKEGYTRIRAVDTKPLDLWYQRFEGLDNRSLNLSEKANCYDVTQEIAHVYNLAADMGGMGFIEHNKALCMLSVLINTHLLMAARDCGVERYFYSSSACVYAADKQLDVENPGLKESDAYPAMPEDGYGWEKLFGERMCRHFMEDFGLATRVARYHNVYGPLGAFEGGREKAPAAISRKVAEAVLSGKHEIEIWGDGEQTRSFTYIDDCTLGTYKLMHSEVSEPLNIGSSQLVSINELVSIVEKLAGVELKRTYKLDAPKGVRGRNSDNTLIRQLLNWVPSVSLVEGVEKTYGWVYDQLASRYK